MKLNAFLCLKATLVLLGLGILMSNAAQAQVNVPTVQIPPSVIAELKLLEAKFETALAADCVNQKCFSQGCTYLSHDTVDRPRGSSLPGLSDKGEGPGSVTAQDFLKAARCEFSVESDVSQKVVEILKQRLRSKLSAGFLTVTVVSKSLPSLPSSLTENDQEIEKKSDEQAKADEELLKAELQNKSVSANKWNELWKHILPHFWWMIGLVLTTLSICVVIWALRKLGKMSPYEQALLAELGSSLEEGGLPRDSKAGSAKNINATGQASDSESKSAAHSADQTLQAYRAAYEERFEKGVVSYDDLLRSLVSLGRVDLAAKLAFRFGRRAGSVQVEDAAAPAARRKHLDAAARLEIAKYLEGHSSGDLVDDAFFYAELERLEAREHLTSTDATRVTCRIREELSPAGFGAIAGLLPSRLAAVLFSFFPYPAKLVAAESLPENMLLSIAGEFMISDRVAPQEFDTLVALFESFERYGSLGDQKETSMSAIEKFVQQGKTLSQGLGGIKGVWGLPMDSAEGLSALLSLLPGRAALDFLNSWKEKHQRLPAWARDVVAPALVLSLSPAKRHEVVLQLSPAETRAWIASFDQQTRQALLQGLPETYLRSVQLASRNTDHETEDFWKNLRLKLVQELKA